MPLRFSSSGIGRTAVLSAAVIALALGCKGKDPIVGKWTDNQGVDLSFNADKTLTQGSGTTSGKWAFHDGKVTITLEKIGGVPVDSYLLKSPATPRTTLTPTELATLKQQTSSIVLALSDDGKTLTPTDPLIAKVRAFKRVESK